MPPAGGVAVTVPTLAYCPAWAVPVAVQIIDSPGSSEVPGQETPTPWSSVTAMPVNVPWPMLVTV